MPLIDDVDGIMLIDERSYQICEPQARGSYVTDTRKPITRPA